jgi:hypothetical protein
VLVHPAVLVPVTLYEVVVVGVNATPLVMFGFQVYVFAPDPLRTTVFPMQTTEVLVLAVTVGRGLTTTEIVAEFWQLFRSVPLTEYVAVAVGEKGVAFTIEAFHV